jgi:predicted ATPase/class 3 adenylate cyclase
MDHAAGCWYKSPQMESCPACGSDAAPLAKFCAECGAALGAPGGRGPPGRTEGELRQLTVMFCDLVGSTELSTRMDAEEFGELIHNYLEAAAGVVHGYEADVARYLGDGILVHFGWPQAHDDDAERAVRAGLGIVAEIDSMNQGLPAKTQMAVRVGIHTGPVMIGEIRGSQQKEMLSLGETLNLAARLQVVAPPNGVVLSATTRDLVRGIFVIEDLGPQTLKGIQGQVPTYRAVQPTGVRSRLDAAQGKLTPMLGRDDELDLLLDCWLRARSGTGAAVLISGEAGVGKSRLVYELRRRLRDAPHSGRECRCSSYTRQSAFRPAVELIEQGLGLQSGDTTEEKLEKLERGLEIAGVETENALELLAPLLSIPLVEDGASLGMSGELRRRRVIARLSGWVIALARPQPMVLLVEDVQWSDPSSLELLEELISGSASAQLLILVTARPEFVSPWQESPELSTVTLSPLRESEAREMVEALHPGTDVPEGVLSRIVAETDGVPLYIEEIGRMVLESGAHGERAWSPDTSPEAIEIPTTLQASLMARLDRLSAAKRVAQHAAVIGRDFSYELLEEVADLDVEALRHSLGQLVEDELLFESGVPPNATYTFKHALIQDAAYQSLLKRTRATLHGRIADALERHPDVGAAAPEVLARHFDAAGRNESAILHYRRAAAQAGESSGYREAIAHLRKAIELLGRLSPDRTRDEAEIEIQIELASAIISSRGYADPDVRTAYERAHVLCEALGSGARVGYTLTGLSIFHFNQGEVHRGEQLAWHVLEIAEQEDDDTLRLLAHVQLAVPICYQGRFAEALEHCEKALEIYDPDRHREIAFRYGTDHGVAAHGFASLSLCLMGYPDSALDRARIAVRLARSLGQPFNVAYALLAETVTDWMRGDLAAQAATAAELAAIAEEQGFDLFTGIGHLCRAAARAIATRDAEALSEMVEGALIAARTGMRGAVPALLTLMAEAQRAVGENAAAIGTVEGALALATETGQAGWNARLLGLRGSLLVEDADDPTEPAFREAEACFREALATAATQGGHLEELRSATSLARLLLLRADEKQASAVLAPVFASFPEPCSIPAVEDARELLDELRAVRAGSR